MYAFVSGAMFILVFHVLLWMLLLAVDTDKKGNAAFLQAPSGYPGTRGGLLQGNFFDSFESPRVSRSTEAGSGSRSTFSDGNVFGQRGATSARTGDTASRGFRSEGRDAVFGNLPDLQFPSREESRDTGYSRPIPAGFGNSFSGNSGNSRRPSAFQNLFGVDIGQSAGIYDSFGKKKPENLAISSQNEPAMNLDFVKNAEMKASHGSYKSYPFSSIRLSPVTQVSGVAIGSNGRPTSQSPFNDQDNFRDKNIMFTGNRAMNYKQDDPFERPIRKSAFPLPNVNDPITLDLAKEEQERVKFAKDNNKLAPIRKLDDDSEAATGFGRSKTPEDDTNLAANSIAPPEGAFGWHKPPTVPELPPLKPVAINKQNASDPNSETSELADALKGASGVKLPELPRNSRNGIRGRVGGNGRSILGNKKLPSDENVPKNGNLTAKSKVPDSEKNTGVNIPNSTNQPAKVDESTYPTLPQNVDEYDDNDSYESSEVFGSRSDESTEDSVEVDTDRNGGDSSSEESYEGVYDSTDNDGLISSSTYRPRPPSPKSETNDNIEEPTRNGNYEVSVFTDEEIMKQSGDVNSVASNGQNPSSSSLEITPNDIPATKRVLERTIEDGRQSVIANETHLPTDHVGFILTDDLYDYDHDNVRDNPSKNIPSSIVAETLSDVIPETTHLPTTKRQENQVIHSGNQHVAGAFNQSPRDYNRKVGVSNNAIQDYTPAKPDEVQIRNDEHPQTDGGFPETQDIYGNNEPVLNVREDVFDGHPSSRQNIGNTQSLDQKPPIGSGYLTGLNYEDSDGPPPPDSFYYPQTNNDAEFSGNDDTSPSSSVDDNINDYDTTLSDGQLSDRTTTARADSKNYNYEDTTLDGKIAGSTKSPAYSNINGYDDMFDSSNTVVEQEHIDLEDLKELQAKSKKDTNDGNGDSIFDKEETKSVDENGLNDFSDYKFDNFGNKELPFSYDNREDEFSINTDPASLNFDLANAGEGSVNIRRSSKAFEPEATRISQLDDKDGDTTTIISNINNGNTVQEGPRDGPVRDNRELVGKSNPSSLTEEFSSDTSEEGATRAFQDDSGQAETGTVGDKGSGVNIKNDDIYTDKFIDYSNYYDPYYDYNAPATATKNPTPRDTGDSPTSPFNKSPFETMFGKTVDQAEQGSFGSLFQNLGAPSGSRGGTKAGGRDLFDDSLNQIVQRRPSLDLFGRRRK